MDQSKVLQAISQYRDAVEATVTAQIHAAMSGLQIHHDKATATAKEEARLYDVVVRFALDHNQPTISLKENSKDLSTSQPSGLTTTRMRSMHSVLEWAHFNSHQEGKSMALTHKYGIGDRVKLVGKIVEILGLQNGYADVKSESGGMGSIPVSCLEKIEDQSLRPSKAYLIKQLQDLALKENPVDKYEEKLCEFLEVLKEGFPDVDGVVALSSVISPKIELILWPSNQVSEKNSILHLSFETGQAKYIGAGSFPFMCNTPEDFWNHLVSLISHTDFQQTLLRLKQRNKEAPT